MDSVGVQASTDRRQLQHPILQTLVGTEHEWIKALISAFNAGEIGKFESLANNFSKEVSHTCSATGIASC